MLGGQRGQWGWGRVHRNRGAGSVRERSFRVGDACDIVSDVGGTLTEMAVALRGLAVG